MQVLWNDPQENSPTLQTVWEKHWNLASPHKPLAFVKSSLPLTSCSKRGRASGSISLTSFDLNFPTSFPEIGHFGGHFNTPQKKTQPDYERLVGGFTTHLKNISSSNWIISPQIGMKIPKICETTTYHLVGGTSFSSHFFSNFLTWRIIPYNLWVATTYKKPSALRVWWIQFRGFGGSNFVAPGDDST